VGSDVEDTDHGATQPPTADIDTNNDILVIMFVRELSPDNHVSVMIDNTLNKDSTIGKVVLDGDVCEQLGIAIESETKVTIKRIVAIFLSNTVRYN